MKLVYLLALLVFSASAFATEQEMNLFPRQRAAHQEAIDTAARNYQERGQDFVDNLYANHAETPVKAEKPAKPEHKKHATHKKSHKTKTTAAATDAPGLSVDTSQTPVENPDTGS